MVKQKTKNKAKGISKLTLGFIFFLASYGLGIFSNGIKYLWTAWFFVFGIVVGIFIGLTRKVK